MKFNLTAGGQQRTLEINDLLLSCEVNIAEHRLPVRSNIADQHNPHEPIAHPREVIHSLLDLLDGSADQC